MTSKYVVVYSLPDYVVDLLKDAYFRTTGRQLLSHNLHISFTYPFFLKDGFEEKWLKSRVVNCRFDEIEGYFSKIDVFEQNYKKILYIKIKPKDKLEKLHLKLNKKLRKGVLYDKRIFENEELPKYLPHVSIDYDFDGDVYTLESLRAEEIKAYFDVSKLSVIRFNEEEFLEI